MTHAPKPAFVGTSGPANPRIVIVGDAWGESEERTRKPFAGQSGRELFRMLGEAMPDIEPELHCHILDLADKYGDAWVGERNAWLEAAGISLTNVFSFRLPGGKLDSLCVSKKEAGAYAGSFAPLQRGQYLREEYFCELDRLYTELEDWNPNLVLAMGNTATWAVLQATNIGSIRGAITQTHFADVQAWAGGTSSDGDRGPEAIPANAGLEAKARAEAQNQASARVQRARKVLPTYHPSGVLRSWAWRPIVVADLMKAARESWFPEIRRPKRRVLVSPTIDEMLAWEQKTYKRGCFDLGVDIETEAKQITMIGFARSPTEAMVVPFWDRTKPGYSYWPDHASERAAWNCVERLLKHDSRKIGQNFIYDLQYLTKFGFQPNNCTADTMLLHHSLFPEMQKGLAFLGSIYTNEVSWKLWRKRKSDTVKADE